MALILLTVQDDEDGTISLNGTAEPFLPDPRSEDIPTPAQTVALIMLSAANEALNGSASLEAGAEQEPEDKPTLFIVGDPGDETSAP